MRVRCGNCLTCLLVSVMKNIIPYQGWQNVFRLSWNKYDMIKGAHWDVRSRECNRNKISSYCSVSQTNLLNSIAISVSSIVSWIVVMDNINLSPILLQPYFTKLKNTFRLLFNFNTLLYVHKISVWTYQNMYQNNCWFFCWCIV